MSYIRYLGFSSVLLSISGDFQCHIYGTSALVISYGRHINTTQRGIVSNIPRAFSDVSITEVCNFITIVDNVDHFVESIMTLL